MLRIHHHQVSDVRTGGSGFHEGILSLDLDALRGLILRDTRLADVELNVARPGDRTRVVNILDVFDARKKAQGPTYPGYDGPAHASGTGDLHRLSNFQILQTGVPPTGEGGLMVARRAFIDFWGPGASWSPFSGMPSLVMALTFATGLTDKSAADDAARRALIAVSMHLGELAVAATPPPFKVDIVPSIWEREPVDNLPSIAYVYQVQSQGALLDTFLYGSALDGLYPTLIDPVELLDGAMLSGNHQRVTTASYHHCNNPVLGDLIAADGISLNLLPVVLMEGHHKSTPAKLRSADHAVQLLRYLGARGAILTQEGGGMSIVDQMLTIEGARRAGIECVAISNEMAGADGLDRPLIHFSSTARNIISAGNRDELVWLDPPERLLGDLDTDAAGRSTESSEQVDLRARAQLPIWALYGSVSQVGAGQARAVAA